MPDGTILILNGASSAGKSSIARALQEILVEPYLEAGLDKFLWMLPSRYLNNPLWNEVLGPASRAGPVGHRLVSGMHHAIAALSRGGNNVVADHVLIEPQWLEECTMLFGALPAFLLAIHCPLAVLEQREQERRDRTLGQARAQYDLVHAHGMYDFAVDTSLHRPEACAQQIKAYLDAGSQPGAFKRLAARRVISCHPE